MRFDFLYDRRRRIFSIGYRLADADGPGRLDALVLRSAGVGGAAGQLRRHRQGRRAAAPLVPPRPPRHQRGRPRHADVVGRHDVRVPDAAAADADASPARCSTRAAARACGGRSTTAGSAACRGASRSRRTRFTDRAGNYQYRAFGVPGLGLKRGLATDLVIAPYATALASLVTPAAAAENFERLAEAGLEGRFGFYEALDYTPRGRDVDEPRRRAPCAPAVVRAFFAHHQGMSLVALANVVCDDVFVVALPRRPARAGDRAAAAGARAARGDPVGAAAGREPRRRRRRCRSSRRGASARRTRRARTRTSCRTAATRRRSPTPAAASACGATSRSRAGATTRPPTPARTSSTCAIRGRAASGRPPTSRSARSPTSSRRPSTSTRSRSAAATATSRRSSRSPCRPRTTSRCGGCRSPTAARRRARSRSRATPRSCWRARGRPRAPGVRQAVHRDRVRSAERRPAVQPPAARRRRVAARRLPRARRRRPRLGGAVEWETDRARFLGRGRSPANPIALDGRALSGTTGAVLDPIGALRERVRLAPGAVVRVTFATGVAPDRDAALALARKYRDGSAAARAFSMAFTHVHITLQHLGLSDEHAMLFDRLASRVFGADASLHQPGRPRRATRSASRTCGATASPAICRSCCVRVADVDVAAARAAAAARAGVLARQGAARRRRHPQRAPGGLSRRDAGRC